MSYDEYDYMPEPPEPTCSWGDCTADPYDVTWPPIPLCVHHWSRLQHDQAKASARHLNYHKPEDLPGVCYIITAPGGTVKIGMSYTPEGLAKRYADAQRKYEQEEPGFVSEMLFELPGGLDVEAALHRAFVDYRVPGTGERFVVGIGIMRWVYHLRFCPGCTP